MKNAKVLVIDPNKFPEYRDIELKDEFVVFDEESETVIGYDSYEIAKTLLKEFNDDDFIIQRVKDNGSRFIDIYVDEEGRLKKLKANRNIILSTNEMVSVAGRMVIIPGCYDSGYVVYADEDKFGKSALRELEEFEKRNHDDGSSPITNLTQEESDKIDYESYVFGDGEDDDFFNTIREIFGI